MARYHSSKPIKSNDLGLMLENEVRAECEVRDCTLFRIHTIRSFKGVSSPCDFVLLDKNFTALLECKATNDDSFSCADFTQLPYFEEAARFPHVAQYGLLVGFYSDHTLFAYVGDKKVMENKKMKRPIRPTNPDSYDILGVSVHDIFGHLEEV